MMEQWKSVRSPPLEEEGVTETTCDELMTTPTPHPSVAPEQGEGREIMNEVKPEKMGGVWGR